MKNLKKWNNEIIYQIYPRSFQDSNNDGIGDLQGIISRLDYLKELGVTMIWISPIYQSPMVDMGYDISDYQNIDPQFGTMEDFDELLHKANKLGIKIIMDLVVNHTSDQHEWFKKALADPKSKYRDYYIFKTTKDGKVPNNWRAIFGGSVWSEVPGEPGTYYFHTFAPQQPDLNWENPALRNEIYKMINWWLEKGIAGFRVDAITHLKKDLDWYSIEPDANDGMATVIKKGQNRPGLEKFLKELKEKSFDKYGAITVGEAYGVPEDQLKDFIGPDGYFTMVFDFSYLNIDVHDVNEWYHGKADWTVKQLKDTIFQSQKDTKAIGGISANVLENHDQNRTLSKLVKDKKFQTPTAAKALGTMYFYLPGVPFIYNGQEIGMKNFHRNSLDEFNDISSHNNYKMCVDEGMTPKEAMDMVNFKSRDNARVPMQWTDGKFGGFSEHMPWLPMGNDREGINVKDEEADKSSVLNYYREMAKLRKDPRYNDILVNGDLVELNTPDDVIGYARTLNDESLIVLVNLSTTDTVVDNIDDTEVLLNNIDTLDINNNQITMKPYQALVLKK